jgi:hypothetical protein
MNPKVKGEPIYRDLSTNALVFTNSDEIAAYNAKKKALRDRDVEINNIKQELDEIKKMLTILLEKSKN